MGSYLPRGELLYYAEGYFGVHVGIGHFGQNEPKKGTQSTGGSRRKFFVREGVPTRSRPPPPRVGDPPPSRGPLFCFSLTPHSPTCDMGLFFLDPHDTTPSPTRDMVLFSPNALQIWPQKGAFRPLLAVKFVPSGRLRHPGRASLAPLRGPGGALASTPCGKVSLGQTAH